MPRVDLGEMSGSHSGDRFEQFARDFLDRLGLQIVEGPSRGSDRGRDLIVSEHLSGIFTNARKRWLVSVKYRGAANRFIGTDVEQNIVDRLAQHKCDGFIGFYSTGATSDLEERLSALGIGYTIYDQGRISQLLLDDPRLATVFEQYLPRSFEASRPSSGFYQLRITTQVGMSFGEDRRLDLELGAHLDFDETGALRVNDPDIEDIMAACMLAHALRRNRFEVLSHFISFRPMVWQYLVTLLKGDRSMASELAAEIDKSQDSFCLRLLIAIAGSTKADECAEAVCKRLVYGGRGHHKTIRLHPTPITPFYDVVKTTLLSLSPSVVDIIESYRDRAARERKWREKQLLSKVVSKLRPT